MKELMRKLQQRKKRVLLSSFLFHRLTTLHLERIRTIFETFDRDKSGDLSATEFQELAFMLGETLTLDEVYERMKVIDQDDNGKISWQEVYPKHLFESHQLLVLRVVDITR